MSITLVWENFTGLSVPCLDKKETDEIFLLLYIAIYSINEEDKPRKSKYFNMKFSNEQVSSQTTVLYAYKDLDHTACSLLYLLVISVQNNYLH